MPAPESKTVTGVTVALNQLFEAAAAILERIKSRRPADSSLLLCRPLEDCLANAAPAITEQRDRGIAWFGQSFENGDDVAVSELLRIRGELSSTLIDGLRKALGDDSFTDFPSLERIAENGRAQALLALGQLYMRLTEAKHRQNVLTATPPPDDHTDRLQQSNSSEAATDAATINTNVTTSTSSSPRNMSRVHSPPMTGPPSYFPQFKLADFKAPFDLGKRKLAATRQWRPRDALKILPSVASSEGRSLSSTESSTRTGSSHTHSHSIENSSMSTIQESSRLSQSEDDENTHPALRVHPGDRIDLTRLITRIVNPYAGNNYLGFCRGAYELFMGNKRAFRKERDMNVMLSSASFLMCAHCPFRCDIPRWKVWSGYGVQFRWDFLAKSHVPQLRIRDRRNLVYQCMFCAFTGQESGAIQGDEMFLLHVAGHRGTEYSDAILKMTNCINGKIADDSEAFDVNLIPLPIEYEVYELPSHDV